MRVYTRTGDAGQTSLANGSRVSKASPRVDAYGTVDELSSTLGVLLAEPLPGIASRHLARVQSLLLDVGAFLASPGGGSALRDEILAPVWLESWIDLMDEELPRLQGFVLPAGARPAALSHVARTVCRRAERAVVLLAAEEPGTGAVVPFLNRLSDTLFTLARYLNLKAGAAEVLWQSPAPRPS